MALKKTHGVVYTPTPLVEQIYAVGGHPQAAPAGKTADIACGDGAFLVPLVPRLIQDALVQGLSPKTVLEQRLAGRDIDPLAVQACRGRLDVAAAALGVQGVAWDLDVADVATPEFLARHQGHFDTIVGNPPYVRVQNLSPGTRAFVQSQTHTGRGATDLYLAFTEIAIQCLRPHGQLLYIMPSSWIRSQAGRGLRRWLARTGALRTLVDFGDRQVFPGALTYVAIIDVVRDGGRATFDVVGAQQETWGAPTRVPMAALDADLPRLDGAATPQRTLGDIAKISGGLATLADRWYGGPLIRQDGPDAWIRTQAGEVQVEAGLLRVLHKASTLRHDDHDQGLRIICPYQRADSGRMVVIPEAELQAQAPHTYAYFTRIRPILDARDKGTWSGPAWYAYGRHQGLDAGGDKLLTSGINPSPRFFRMRDPTALFLSGYAITGPNLEQLQALLNSPAMDQFVRTHGRPFQQGWWSYAKSVISHFPVNLDPSQIA